ncbi:hypothetical protein IVB30_32900 [Bradyrhizobium sp. 200]|nr:hypothetical protein IVB30_32900 [Bradyrhizobium sp. 200]
MKLRVHPEFKAPADRLPVITHGAVQDITALAMIGLRILFVLYGGEMLSLIETATAWSLPISMVYLYLYLYLVVLVGGALLILHALVRMVVAPVARYGETPVGASEYRPHLTVGRRDRVGSSCWQRPSWARRADLHWNCEHACRRVDRRAAAGRSTAALCQPV